MSEVALELRNVRKQFGRTEIICGVDLSVVSGERIALIGPNGAGKSTLFSLISGRTPLTSGEICINGRSIAGLKPFEISRLGLSRSFQVSNIFHRLSVYENLRCAVLWSLGYRYSFWQRVACLKDVRERTETVLEQIGLARLRNLEAGRLTYAEQRSLELGITIAGNANIILLDEPTAGMSRHESETMVELIRNIATGKTLIMVEHDMNVAFGLAEKVAVLVYGEIIAFGSPSSIRANPEVQEAYLGMRAGVEH